MVPMLRVEIGWSGKTCELGFIARRRFQGRKGEIERKIWLWHFWKGEIRWWLREEEGA
jgi:hypothetical protein